MLNESSHHCTVLSTEAELEAALSDSFERPLVLMKHSEWCGWSQRVTEAALGELERWATHVGCRVLVVQNHPDLSNAIARRFGICHETPQVIVVRNGQVTWHAAHSDITSHALRRAIRMEVGASHPA